MDTQTQQSHLCYRMEMETTMNKVIEKMSVYKLKKNVHGLCTTHATHTESELLAFH